MNEIAWLIECGSPATYYCGEGDWCSNPNHAHRFATKGEAEQKAAGMTTIEPVRVCDHMWVGDPSPPAAAQGVELADMLEREFTRISALPSDEDMRHQGAKLFGQHIVEGTI